MDGGGSSLLQPDRSPAEQQSVLQRRGVKVSGPGPINAPRSLDHSGHGPTRSGLKRWSRISSAMQIALLRSHLDIFAGSHPRHLPSSCSNTGVSHILVSADPLLAFLHWIAHSGLN